MAMGRSHCFRTHQCNIYCIRGVLYSRCTCGPAFLCWWLLPGLMLYFFPLCFLFLFSVQLSNFVEGLGVDVYLPTEPLLGILLIIYGLRYIGGFRTDLRILRHPVTLAIYFHLVWMAVTVISSSDPVVSLKFFCFHGCGLL